MCFCDSVWEIIGQADGGLSVLRTFRLLRVLKLVRFLPALRRQLVVLMKTMDNVATFCMLLMLFIFTFRCRPHPQLTQLIKTGFGASCHQNYNLNFRKLCAYSMINNHLWKPSLGKMYLKCDLFCFENFLASVFTIGTLGSNVLKMCCLVINIILDVRAQMFIHFIFLLPSIQHSWNASVWMQIQLEDGEWRHYSRQEKL